MRLGLVVTQLLLQRGELHWVLGLLGFLHNPLLKNLYHGVETKVFRKLSRFGVLDLNFVQGEVENLI